MHRVQVQSRMKKDFIGRNRRAVRDLGKAPPQEKEEKGKETSENRVEISRDDLDRLLKMAAALQQPTAPSNPHSQNQQLPEYLPQLREREREKEGHEEYYPWGRPGGGAPIRTVSGTLLTNYSTRGQEVESMRESIPRQPLSNSVHISPPQKPMFARGVGPHVDSFMLTQREEQRRKEQFHKEELAAQIAERQRQREAERRRKEEEEMEAESMRESIPRQPPSNSVNISPPQKPMFARGVGPHVDSFMLTQREEQRRKEQFHKEELAAQIAERQRQKEAERRRKEEEEMEAERKVRQELEEMRRRNEMERERKQLKAEEERRWQAELHSRVQEAEEAAVREKQRRAVRAVNQPQPLEQTQAKHSRLSRIPLATHRKRDLSHRAQPAPPLPAVTKSTSRPHPPLSPVVPALAKKLGLPPVNVRQPQISPAAAPPKHRPTEPPTVPSSSLPSLHPPTQHTSTDFPSRPPSAVASQQAILNKIAILREGIISQRKSLDSRFQHHCSSSRHT